MKKTGSESIRAKRQKQREDTKQKKGFRKNCKAK